MLIKEFAVIHLRESWTPQNWEEILNNSSILYIEDFPHLWDFFSYKRIYIPMVPGLYKAQVADLAYCLHAMGVNYISRLENFCYDMVDTVEAHEFYLRMFERGMFNHD